MIIFTDQNILLCFSEVLTNNKMYKPPYSNQKVLSNLYIRLEMKKHDKAFS